MFLCINLFFTDIDLFIKLFQRHKQSETNPNATGNFSYNFPKASDNDKDFFTDQIELNEIYNEISYCFSELIKLVEYTKIITTTV